MHRSRLRSIVLIAVSLIDFVFTIATAIILSPIHVCTSVLRADYGHGWRVGLDYCLVAFRKIRDLTPVYRDSYDTHGLNLPINSLRI